MKQGSLPVPSHRRYYRIPSVVPVDYQLCADSGEPLDAEIRTGFTRDMSEGGLCLRVRTLPEALGRHLDEKSRETRITVDIALPKRPLRVRGQVVWAEKLQEGSGQIRLLGVSFDRLAEDDAAAIAGYAKRAAMRPKIAKTVTGVLLSLLLLSIVVYQWSRVHYQEELEGSQHQLHEMRTQYVEETDKMGDMYVELRWLTMEVRNLIDTLEQNEGEEGGDREKTGPVLDDLGRNIDRLSEIVRKLKAPQE